MEIFVATPDLVVVRFKSSGEITTGYYTPGHFEAVISGSGKIFAYVLSNLNCKAVISGSGNMFVNSSRRL